MQKSAYRFKTNPLFQGVSIDFKEQPIFVVQKRLLYEKTSIFYEKYDAIKIK